MTIFLAAFATTSSSSFGLMDAKFERSNEAATERNAGMLGNLVTKANEKPKEFEEAAEKANQIAVVSEDKVFVHEWAHYRYGVFDEYPTDSSGNQLPWRDNDGKNHTCGPNINLLNVTGKNVVYPLPNRAKASLMSVTIGTVLFVLFSLQY